MNISTLIPADDAFAVLLTASVLVQVFVGVPMASHAESRGGLPAPLLVVAIGAAVFFAGMGVVGLLNLSNESWAPRLALTSFVCGAAGAGVFVATILTRGPPAEEMDAVVMRDLMD